MRARTTSARIPSTSTAAQTAEIRTSSRSVSTTAPSRDRAAVERVPQLVLGGREAGGEAGRVGVVGEAAAHHLGALGDGP